MGNGRSFQEVLATDPEYCQWVLQESKKEDVGFRMQEFAAFLDDKSELQQPAAKEDGKVSFGKYKGRSFQEVLATDPQYCQWVLQESSGDSGNGMQTFAAFLSERP